MTSGRKPRVTGAKKHSCLLTELESLLAAWDSTANPVLQSAAGQLRQSMAKATTAAYSEQAEWEQQRYEEQLS